MEDSKDNKAEIMEDPSPSGNDEVAKRLARLEHSVDKLATAVTKADKDIENTAPEKKHKAASRLVLAATFAIIGHEIGSHIGLRTGFYFKARKLLSTANPFKFGKAALAQPDKALPLLISTGSSTLIGGFIGTAVGAVTGFWRGNRINRPSDLISQPVESIQQILGSTPGNDKESLEMPHTPARQWTKRVEPEAVVNQAMMR